MGTPNENAGKIRSTIFLVLGVLGVGMSCFHLFTAAIGSLPTMEQRSIHLSFVLGLIFLRSATRRPGAFGVRDIVDCILAVLGVAVTLYAAGNWMDMAARGAFPEDIDLVMGVILVALV
ncbi:MAG: C4-dicarboxylate ABC transporter permease, partial [Deltaproteobacteria bacterium]|nr:C4-dicarboxylate ABC transporter permease [Deltaproteobacteria bacterium]